MDWKTIGEVTLLFVCCGYLAASEFFGEFLPVLRPAEREQLLQDFATGLRDGISRFG